MFVATYTAYDVISQKVVHVVHTVESLASSVRVAPGIWLPGAEGSGNTAVETPRNGTK